MRWMDAREYVTCAKGPDARKLRISTPDSEGLARRRINGGRSAGTRRPIVPGGAASIIPLALSIQGQRFQAAPHAGSKGSADGMPERAPRRASVIVGIVAAVCVFLAMVAFLLYRSVTKPEPSRVALVQGSEAWLGGEVIIGGGKLTAPITAVIEASGRYSIPFFLDPGDYTMRVRMGGVEVFRDTFSLDETDVRHIYLPKQVPPPPAPATAPAASTTTTIGG